jgi:retron-type reverse transcriptase
MDDITKTQQSFARKALTNPQHQFTDLYHLLCREDWIRYALTRVLANKGSRTAGVDHLTRKRFADETYTQKFIVELREALRSGRFQPQPARRVYIPKPNGAQRPLGIPMPGSYCISLQAHFACRWGGCGRPPLLYI